MTFQIGDTVKPRQGWQHYDEPTGTVIRVEPFGQGSLVSVRDNATGQIVVRPSGMFELVERAYNAEDDFAQSINACYSAVNERKAAGGKGWEPK